MRRVLLGTCVALGCGCAETLPATAREDSSAQHRRVIEAVERNDPSSVAASVRRDADAIERDIVREVRRGDLEPTALGDVRARRAFIERLLVEYTADGYIHRDERRHLHSLIEDMRDAKLRYREAYGGGPR